MLIYKRGPIEREVTYGAWLLQVQLRAIVHFQAENQTLVGLPEEVQLVEGLVAGPLVVELRPEEAFAEQVRAHKAMPPV